MGPSSIHCPAPRAKEDVWVNGWVEGNGVVVRRRHHVHEHVVRRSWCRTDGSDRLWRHDHEVFAQRILLDLARRLLQSRHLGDGIPTLPEPRNRNGSSRSVVMRIVCSYCRAELGKKEPLDVDVVTDGMCEPCFEHFTRQWEGLRLGEYLGTSKEMTGP